MGWKEKKDEQRTELDFVRICPKIQKREENRIGHDCVFSVVVFKLQRKASFVYYFSSADDDAQLDDKNKMS